MRQAVLLFLSLAALPGQVLKFGVIGDSGTGDEHQKAVASQMRAYRNQWKFVLMLGDNIYYDGNPADFQAKFKDPYKEFFDAGVKFHATLGNHDRKHSNAALGCKQVLDPAFGFEGQRDEYFFSDDTMVGGKKLARFMSLNADGWHAGAADSTTCRGTTQTRLAQLQSWLADSGQYHWNIVYFHNPIYSYINHWLIPPFFNGHGSDKKLRALLEPHLKGRVNVVFSGHDHFYQKIRPQNGIHYFVSGGAAKRRFGGNFGHKNVEAGAKKLHFINIDLSQDELRYQTIDSNGAVFHSGAIRR